MRHIITHAVTAAPRQWLAAFAAMVCALILASCATTRLDTQWSNPEFAGRKMSGKILVVGVSRDETLRRLYEDELAAQLTTRGLATIRSYEVLPGPLVMDGTNAILKAARDANAAAVLSSAVVAREHVERVISEPTPSFGSRFSGWYVYYWPYAYARTEVRAFDRYTVGTSLTDVATGKITWSARTQTENVDHAAREVKALARVIMNALNQSNML
jgi:hypothetical protein